MGTGETGGKGREKWIFSLALPFPSGHQRRSMELISFQSDNEILHTGNGKKGKKKNSSTLSSESIVAERKSSETRSLLDNEPDGYDSKDCIYPKDLRETHGNSSSNCWKFYNSARGLSLQSSSLLRLSYRPAWQSMPEFTKGKRQRALYRSLMCCCPSDEDLEEQIWEIYSTEHISKTKRLKITIRGIGECQAIQVYLKTLGDKNLDLETPRAFETPLELHQQRSGGQNEESWTRFSEPEDNLPNIENETASNEFIVLTFAMPLHPNLCGNDDDTPLLWKVDVPPHRSGHVMSLDTITLFDGTVDLQEAATHVYIEGFQSWSFSGSVLKGHPQPSSAMPYVFSRAFNLGGCLPEPPTTVMPSSGWQTNMCNPEIFESPQNKNSIGTKNKGNRYKSDFFSCITTGRNEIMDENGGPALVCGWLSQHKQFGVISIDDRLENLIMHATHEALLHNRVSTDWSYTQLITPHRYDEEPMVQYLHAVAAYNQAEPLQNGPLLTGWCSWYHYYENITEKNLRTNFNRLTKLKQKVPTNMAMVDDGYMTAWGDWDSLKPKKFTTMDVIASDIAASHMRPGLWMAPFTADKHSKIAKYHPEWIIRNERGSPANSSNCGKFFYGLDATNPQVREYVFNSIRRAVHDWGFRVLKIDFLYAACLEGNGKYDLSTTRAEAMHLALKTIRKAAGSDVFLIGCGCPIASGIGYIDGMRVSADTGPTWYPELPLPWWDNGTLPSLRGMIRNSMSRAPMGHRWWQNDPDCLLLGESTKLTHEEVVSAASIIAMTCGVLLVSDDLTKVSQERMQVLTRIFPMTGVTGVILDLHTTRNKGMPSLIRLWCTDRYRCLENFRSSRSLYRSLEEENFSAEATFFGKQSAFNKQTSFASSNNYERTRSCIHVGKGMGTWTVISLSNWDDQPKVLRIPRLAIYSPPETGFGTYDMSSSTIHSVSDDEDGSVYHVFSTWSGKYKWLSLKKNDHYPISRKFLAHETEIFHIRKVTPLKPQYIGSDLHFSCGHEVLVFHVSPEENNVIIYLKTELNRAGNVFLFIPRVDMSHVRVTMAGNPTPWEVICTVPNEDSSPSHSCGRIIRVMVTVQADGSSDDGEIGVYY